MPAVWGHGRITRKYNWCGFFIYFFKLLVTLVTDRSAPPGTVLILTLIARSLRLDHGTGEALFVVWKKRKKKMYTFGFVRILDLFAVQDVRDKATYLPVPHTHMRAHTHTHAHTHPATRTTRVLVLLEFYFDYVFYEYVSTYLLLQVGAGERSRGWNLFHTYLTRLADK